MAARNATNACLEEAPSAKRHKPIPFEDHEGPRIAAYGAPIVFRNPAVVERLYNAVNDLRVKGKKTKKLRKEARNALIPYADWMQCKMHAYPSADPESPVYVNMSMYGRKGAEDTRVCGWYCHLKQDLTLHTGLSAWSGYDGQPLIDDDTLRSLGAEPTPPAPPHVVVTVLCPRGNTCKFAIDASARPRRLFDRLRVTEHYPPKNVRLVPMNESRDLRIDPDSTVPIGELLGPDLALRMKVGRQP